MVASFGKGSKSLFPFSKELIKETIMFYPEKITKVAMKMRKMAFIWNKKISSPSTMRGIEADCLRALLVVDKGHFVIYTIERRHFVMSFHILVTT